jgi:hypothetical protein
MHLLLLLAAVQVAAGGPGIHCWRTCCGATIGDTPPTHASAYAVLLLLAAVLVADGGPGIRCWCMCCGAIIGNLLPFMPVLLLSPWYCCAGC